jgi:hypothetical protein
MTASVVKLATLRDLIEARLVQAATIVGEKGGWAVTVSYGEAERVLAGKDGAPRHFAKLDTAARQLLELGLVSFLVRGADYEQAAVRATRPDRSVAMKAANAYGTWLKQEVAQTQDAIARGEMALLSEADMESRWKAKRLDREKRRREAGV